MVRKEDIIKQLLEESTKAYAPYSHFPIASAIVTKDDEIFTGVNVENASYGLSMCAERVAMYHAMSKHVHKDGIMALYVVSPQVDLVYPCGACLQVMKELLPKDCKIVIANKEEAKEYVLCDLYPFAFDKEDLHGV